MNQQTHQPFNLWSHLAGVFILLIPLISSHQVLDPVLLPRALVLQLFVLVLALGLFFRPQQKFTFNFPLLALGGTGILFILSGFQALHMAEYAHSTTRFLSVLFALVLFYQLFVNDRINVTGLARYVLGFCLLADMLTAYEIWGKMGELSEGENLYQIKTPFAHKNLFSSAQICCLPFLIHMLLFDGMRWKWLSGIVMAGWLFLVLFIQTKAVLFGIAIAAVITGFLFVLTATAKYKKVFIFFLLVAGIGGTILLMILSKYEIFSLLLNTTTFKERLLLWDNTWRMIKDHPFAGVGAGNWQIYFPHYGLRQFLSTNYLISDGYTTFQRPHNDFLWVFAETGMAGFLCYILFFIGLFFSVVIGFVKSTGKEKWFWLSVFFALLIYVFNAAFDFPLERSEHQLLLAILAAYISAKQFSNSHGLFSRLKLMVSSRLTAMVITGFSLFALYITSYRISGESHSRKLILAHGKGNWQQMISEGKKAINPWYNMDNFSIPVDWYIGVAKFALNDLKSAKVHFEQAYQINPYQVHVLNNYAACFEKEGNHARAIELYDELLRISPASPDGIVNKSGALYNAGRYVEAFYTITKFKWDENNTQFQTFMVAIVQSYLELRSKREKDKNKAAKMRYYWSNEEVIKNLYKESSVKGVSFVTLIHQRINE